MNLLTCRNQVFFDTYSFKKGFEKLLSHQILKAMKLTFVFITAFFLQVSAKGVSQNVTLTLNNVTIDKVFREIEKQTGIGFLFTKKMLLHTPKVSINVKNEPVNQVLQYCFRGQPLTYKIQDNTIIISPKPMSVVPLVALTPPPILHGKVFDAKGKPLEGVSVIVKGSSNGTATDEKGEYELKNVDDNAVLTFSHVGYVSQTLAAKGRSVINVSLVLDVKQESDLVVIGYGTQREVDLTGAVSTINAKEISQDHSVINATDMLEGRIPGLNVLKTGGAPGGGSDLYVNGLGTFNNSSPLIVVDGIPGRSIDDINPNDIASISVLKDAASVAVYGARAANGVILVTTKKGSIGKPQITFSTNLINQRPTQIYKQLNSYQYVTLYNEALQNEDSYNTAIGSGWTDAQVQKFKDGSDPNNYPNTDWYHELVSPSILQSSYNLSASGGTENTKYYISAGYVNDNGLVPVEGYKRYNLRANITSTIAQNLKLNLDLTGIYTQSHGEAVYGSEYVIQQVYGTPPIRVNKFTNGTYAYVPEQRGSAAQQALGQTGFNDNDNNVVNSNLSLTYDIPWVKGLSVKGLMAYDKTMSFGKDFAKPTDMYSLDASGDYTLVPAYPTAPYLSESYSQDYNITLQGSVNYEKFFAGNHITGMLLYEQSQEDADNFTTQRSNFVSSSLAELNLGDPTRVSNSGTGSESARQGVVGRATYAYKDKYLAEFNFRYDGSDIFPPANRFGFFPSVSAGWVLSQEPFFKKALPAVNFLKVRGSWGQLGNDQVSPFQFLSTYSLIGGGYSGGGYTFGGLIPFFIRH